MPGKEVPGKEAGGCHRRVGSDGMNSPGGPGPWAGIAVGHIPSWEGRACIRESLVCVKGRARSLRSGPHRAEAVVRPFLPPLPRKPDALGQEEGSGPCELTPARPVLSGVADEAALQEERLRRGQSALPSQPASTSGPSPRSHGPAALPKHQSPPVCEEEDESGRQRAAGSPWNPFMLSAGVQRGTGVARPHGDAPLPSQDQRGQRSLLCCCVLT